MKVKEFKAFEEKIIFKDIFKTARFSLTEIARFKVVFNSLIGLDMTFKILLIKKDS